MCFNKNSSKDVQNSETDEHICLHIRSDTDLLFGNASSTTLLPNADVRNDSWKCHKLHVFAGLWVQLHVGRSGSHLSGIQYDLRSLGPKLRAMRLYANLVLIYSA